jgi:ketosteroid isomerase-like protein
MADTPDVVARYLKAAESRDIDTLVTCFTEGATVVDEGETYRGRDAIRAWREALASTFTYTVEVTGTEAVGDEYRVTTHIEGDFPGGVVDLTYRFRLDGDLISSLVI